MQSMHAVVMDLGCLLRHRTRFVLLSRTTNRPQHARFARPRNLSGALLLFNSAVLHTAGPTRSLGALTSHHSYIARICCTAFQSVYMTCLKRVYACTPQIAATSLLSRSAHPIAESEVTLPKSFRVPPRPCCAPTQFLNLDSDLCLDNCFTFRTQAVCA